MYIEPNKERLSRLRNISDTDLGLQIAFCPECDWQFTVRASCGNKCPDCGSNLHLTTVDNDLLELINGGMTRKDRDRYATPVYVGSSPSSASRGRHPAG